MALTVDDLRKMDPDKLARLEANLVKLEKSGERREDAMALRYQFNQMRKVRDLRGMMLKTIAEARAKQMQQAIADDLEALAAPDKPKGDTA